MPKAAIVSKAQMRSELASYYRQAHVPYMYISDVLPVLKEMWARARTHRVDVWRELGAYVHGTHKDKVTGSSIKSAFRRFLGKPQQGRCCYCRCWLVGSGHARPIEHILPRDAYPQFSLDFWNLAVACADCNLAKTAHVWGTIPRAAHIYPGPEAFLDMFHPRYHAYDDHVRYVVVETNHGGIALYQGLTAQGKDLCLRLLDKIASRRALIDDHPELGASMNEIDHYRAEMDRTVAPELHAFAHMLDTALMDILHS